MLTATKAGDFLNKVNDKVGGYLWLILAAAVILLIVILFIVIGHKNKRIKKLKKEIKNTRTQLENEKSKNLQEQTFAPVTGNKAVFGEDDTQTEEIETEPEPVKKKNAASLDDELEREAQKTSYYNKGAVVSQKDGNIKFTVKYDRNRDSWIIKKDGVDRPVRRLDTKEEALNVARALCKKYNANLVVHKKDGKFQKQ